MIRRLLLSLALPLAVSLVAATPAFAQPSATATGNGPLSGHTIVIDPGHGLYHGHYTGAHGANGAWEDANAYAIAQRLVTLLKAQGATALLTRGVQDPGPPPVQGLIARVHFAEQHHAQVFVSLHQDDSGNPAAHGVWTYYDHPNSRLLATDIQRQMVRDTGMHSLGTPTAPFYVLRNTTMPSVLVEGGFLSNPAQARRISTPAFHQQEAVAVDQGLLAYFNGSAGGAAGVAPASRAQRIRGPVTLGARRPGALRARRPIVLRARHLGVQRLHRPGALRTRRLGVQRLRRPSVLRTRRLGVQRLRRPSALRTRRLGVQRARRPGVLRTNRRSPRLSVARLGGARRSITMLATAYGPSLRDNYPYGAVDAYGKPLKAGDVAVDPRVIPLGSRVCVSGYHSPYLPAGGFCGVARDTGGAIKGDRIDIFINGNPAQVSSFGRQRVRVTVG